MGIIRGFFDTRHVSARVFVLSAIIAVLLMGMVGCASAEVTPAPILPSDLLLSSSEEITQFEHDIAFDGTNYLVVWANTTTGNIGIKGRFISPDGTFVGDPFVIQDRYTNGEPKVAFLDGTYVVIYTNVDGNHHLCGKTITPNGVVGSEFTISWIYPNPYYEFDICSNGISYLVIWEDQRDFSAGNYLDIYGQRLSSTGTLLGDEFRISPAEKSQNQASLTSNNDDFFVVWVEDPTPNAGICDIYGTRVTADGIVVDTPPISISLATEYQSYPQIAYGDGTYLVVWGSAPAGYSGSFRGMRIDNNGNLLDGSAETDGFQISGLGYAGCVGFDGINWIVINMNDYSKLHATRISPDGTILDPIPRQISRTSPHQIPPVIAFDGTNYMVTWAQSTSSYAYNYIYCQIVTLSNSIPVANAGNDITIPYGIGGILDGTHSSDLENNLPLTYSWKVLSYPQGSTFKWITDTTAQPAINPDLIGDYTIQLTVTDSRMTPSTPDTVIVTVAEVNNPPVLDSIGSKSVNEGESFSFTLSATDPDGQELTFSSNALPTGATLTGALFTWTPDYSQAGTYPITFTASDGTLTDSETITISITNVNRAPVLAAVGDKAVSEGTALTFTLSATDPDGQELTFSSNALPTGASLADAEFAWTPDYSQAGTYPITFTASDGTLTDSETITISITNVNRAPVLAAVGDKAVSEGTALTFTLSATDPDGQELTFSSNALPTGATLIGALFTWTPDYSQAGIYPITFTASDGTLTDSETITISITNVNRAPVLTAIGDKTSSEGTALTFTLSATDPDGQELTFSSSALPTGASLADAEFAWTPEYDQAGTHPITFTVSDGILTDSEDIVITVDNVNRAPELDAIGDKTVTEGSALTFSISGSDPDGQTITYSSSALPEGATFFGTEFAWTPNYNQAGSYPITFSVSDGTLTDTESITITVVDSNHAPELDAIGDKTVSEGTELTFILVATDPDGQTLTFTANTLPTGSTLNGATFSWTPGYDQAGSYPITFTVSDGALTDTESILITVMDTNRPPVLASTGDKTATEGTTLTFTLSATDPDGQSLVYSSTTLPIGAILTDTVFTWTPDYSQAGTYPITFTASDGTLTDSESITITITEGNRAPVLTPIGPKSVNEGTLLEFTVSATDADNDPLIYSLADFPVGAGFSGDSNTFSWTPRYDQAGAYTVNCSVSDGSNVDYELVTITVSNVNLLPVADAGGPYEQNENVAVTLDGSGSYSPEGHSLNYRWDFTNDGTYDTVWLSVPTRTYSWSDDFSGMVKLEVRDAASGAVNSTTSPVTILNLPPTVTIQNGASIEGYVNEPVSLTIRIVDPGVDQFSYSLDDGNGYVSTGNLGSTSYWYPTVTYDSAGIYTVIADITDDNGGTGQDSIDVNIIGTRPVASFEYSPTEPAVGDTVQFTDTSSDEDGLIVDWYWQISDHDTTQEFHEQNINYQFMAPGYSSVWLQVTDDQGLTSETSLDVSVSGDSSIANFYTVPQYPAPGDEVMFLDDSTILYDEFGNYLDNLEWYFDDTGEYSSDLPATHTYDTAGDYTVTLTIWDMFANYEYTEPGTVTKIIHVEERPPGPVADFYTDEREGAAPFYVVFTDASIDAETWDWNFGDGTANSTVQFPEHEYSAPGSYTVILTVTNAEGTSTQIKPGYISVTVGNQPPDASFSLTPESPTAGDTVQFTDLSTDPEGDYFEVGWDFGDESYSSEQNPTHMYQEAGLYLIGLTATDDYGASGEGYWPLIVNAEGSTMYALVCPGVTIEYPHISINTDLTEDFISQDIISINSDTIEFTMNGLTMTVVTGGLSTSDDIIEGDIVSMSIENTPVQSNIPSIGAVMTSFAANLVGVSSDSTMSVKITDTASPDVMSAYEIAAVDENLEIVSIAYAFNIDGTTVDDGVEVADATIVMTAPESWVDAQGGPENLRIFRYAGDGTTQILVPTWTLASQIYTFSAFSPDGLSVFGLISIMGEEPADSAAPTIQNILASPNPAAINSVVTLSATFDDTGTGNSPLGSVLYSTDGSTWTAMTASDGALGEAVEEVTATLPGYSVADILSITIKATDAYGNTAISEPTLLAIYDPNGAFITAGGWFTSPPGAYKAAPAITGKANLGLNSKYKKGTSIPTGETEFHLKEADLKFKSTTYDWMVINGAKATYRGSGTVNGAGDYGFLVSAIAGEISGGEDLIRFKIWDKATNTVIYDNGAGSDSSNPITPLGGGNIKIHA